MNQQGSPHDPNNFNHLTSSESTQTQTRTGTGTSDTVVVPIPPGTELLALQIQAFLRASQDEELDGDVEFDEEVVTDILSVLSGSGEDGVDMDGQMEDGDGDDSSDDTGDLMHFAGAGEGRGDSLQDSPSPSTWQKHEIKTMIHLLKERGPKEFIFEYVHTLSIPIPRLLEALGVSLCPELRNRKPKTMLYFLQVALAHARRKRDKLSKYNTIEDAVRLIRQSQRILILTGAGISVSCGIPDFRSRNGLYATLKDRGEYELDDPQQMFDIEYFRENPAGLVQSSFASQIYPSNFEPSPCHRFIKLIENKGKLLRNYTQNIDTLEMRAGVKKVLQCHGSFATASCLNCRRRVDGREIESEILAGRVPLCVVCNSAAVNQSKKGAVKRSKKKKKGEWDSDCEDESDGPEYPSGVMKPDITFFGEKLTDEFDDCLAGDRFKVDLLLVIGTSLKVSPVAEILSHLPHSIPQILINKTPVRHINPDVVLLGNADDIVIYLCEQLSWELPLLSTPTRTQKQTPSAAQTSIRDGNLLQVPRTSHNLKKRPSEDEDLGQLRRVRHPRRVGESHVWLFEGAEGGKWLQQLQRELGVTDSSDGTRVGTPMWFVGDKTRSSTPCRQVKVDDTEGGERREPKKQRVI